MSQNGLELPPQAEVYRSSIHVLYVDDDTSLTELVPTFLERESESFDITTASCASDGVAKLTDREFDCIVSDYQMPERDGLEFLEDVKETHPDLPFLLYTGQGSEEIASQAINAGVDEYLQKQSDTDHYSVLANRIRNLVDRYQSEQETKRILNRMTDSFFALDADWRFTYLNDSAQELLGATRDELLGARIWDTFPEMIEKGYQSQYQTAMETQDPIVLVEQCPVTDRPLKEHIYPSPTGLSVYFHEVSEDMHER